MKPDKPQQQVIHGRVRISLWAKRGHPIHTISFDRRRSEQHEWYPTASFPPADIPDLVASLQAANVRMSVKAAPTSQAATTPAPKSATPPTPRGPSPTPKATAAASEPPFTPASVSLPSKPEIVAPPNAATSLKSGEAEKRRIEPTIPSRKALRPINAPKLARSKRQPQIVRMSSAASRSR